jgi:RHS repeat-associated protein
MSHGTHAGLLRHGCDRKTSGPVVDAESGLIYLRARYYDPATGQFLNRDPLVDETRAPYSYAGNNPLNRTDPSGLCNDPIGYEGPVIPCPGDLPPEPPKWKTVSTWYSQETPYESFPGIVMTPETKFRTRYDFQERVSGDTVCFRLAITLERKSRWQAGLGWLSLGSQEEPDWTQAWPTKYRNLETNVQIDNGERRYGRFS